MVASVANPGTRTVASDLAEVRRGCWAYEVAHKRDMEHYEKITRAMGIFVVVLTAATGTAVVTALATTTNTAAKVIVGVLSVASAVAAALNEKGPFADQQKLHLEKSASYSTISREAVVLHREWCRGEIDDDKVDGELTKLERSYDDLKKTTPGVRDYVSAREWVEKHELPDELLS